MPADPRRVKDLFSAAAGRADPSDRRAFLDRECGADPDLRQRVDVLLAAHDRPEPALGRPLAAPVGTGTRSFAQGDGTPTADYAPADAGGPFIDRYKLLEAIGEGGMGEVWVADQLEPLRRRVALKVIKPGMDSRSVLARFEAERQALALMDHPNIAKVLDAGATPDGRPYFAMELVKGTPITEFCDARKLTPKERLELFVPVCHAVQHAHQKGIIHRDIKPSNVLVELHDEKPVPKVIDFGVAKAVGQQLTDKTIYTGFGVLVGTPAYMAPEQATFNALDVDTRADVYSLGVLLYELLAGSPPFDPGTLKRAALDEMLRIVREVEPPTPSARLSTSQTRASIAAVRRTDPARLTKLVRGELDWIVMKALDKDRTRRYDSANGFAADVTRYLTGEPVLAVPPSAGYRVRKAYRKNRAVVWVAAAFALVLVAAAGVSVAFGLLAKRAAADAVAARDAEAEQRAAAVDAGIEATRQRNEAVEAGTRLRLAQEEQQASQYVWDMQLLPLAFEANNVAEVKRVLDRHIPRPGQADRRGFEWRYWDRQLHTDLRTERLQGVAEAQGLAVWAASPDGSRVARFVTPQDGGGEAVDPPTLTVWDIASRQVVLMHRMPIERPVNQSYVRTPPKAPLFSRDGKRVAVEWGYLIPAPPPQPGGRHLRQVLEVAGGKVLLNLEGDQRHRATGFASRGEIDGAFSPDGSRFAAVCRDPATKPAVPVPPARVRVWELEGGKEVCPPLDADALVGSPFDAGGTLLVAQNRLANATRVSVWDLACGRERAGWDLPGAELSSLAVSPDGVRVAGAMSAPAARAKRNDTPPAGPRVKIWDITGKELHTLAPPGLTPQTRTLRVFFSPDGSRLAVERPAELTAGISPGDLTIWDTATGRPLPSPAGLEVRAGPPGGGSGPGFSPDGKQVVNAEGNVLRTWDVETGRPVLTLRGHVNPIAARGFTADGTRLWSAEHDGLFKEWGARPGHVEIRFAAPVAPAGLGGTATPLSVLAVSPEGSRVASLVAVRADIRPNAPQAVAVRVWDADGKSVQILRPPDREADPARRPFYGLALSRDGRRAALTRHETGFVFGEEKESATPPDLTVWDVESNAVLLHRQLERGHAQHAAISADGKTVAVVSQAAARGRPSVRLFDIDGRRERPPLAVTERTGVSSLTFSPDGRRLAALCSTLDAAAYKTSAEIGVWDAESGSQLAAIDLFRGRPVQNGITTAVRIAWSPDGSRFVFSPDTGRNAELAVYDTAGKKVLTLDEPVAAGVETSGVQYVAYSPDGRRVAALQLARAVGGVPVLKMWDAATGKELLSLRPKLPGEGFGDKSLTFTGDGHRLQLTASGAGRRSPSAGGGVSSLHSLTLMTWDAAPVPGREPSHP